MLLKFSDMGNYPETFFGWKMNNLAEVIEMSWSKDIPTEWDYVQIPMFPDGAELDVEFKCAKCGRTLLTDVDLPAWGIGDNEEESRRWGDGATVECECGETYELVADNSIAGWDVNFEEGEEPKTFRYKVTKDHGEPEEDSEEDS